MESSNTTDYNNRLTERMKLYEFYTGAFVQQSRTRTMVGLPSKFGYAWAQIIRTKSLKQMLDCFYYGQMQQAQTITCTAGLCCIALPLPIAYQQYYIQWLSQQAYYYRYYLLLHFKYIIFQYTVASRYQMHLCNVYDDRIIYT